MCRRGKCTSASDDAGGGSDASVVDSARRDSTGDEHSAADRAAADVIAGTDVTSAADVTARLDTAASSDVVQPDSVVFPDVNGRDVAEPHGCQGVACDTSTSCDATCTLDGPTKWCRSLDGGPYRWIAEQSGCDPPLVWPHPPNLTVTIISVSPPARVLLPRQPKPEQAAGVSAFGIPFMEIPPPLILGGWRQYFVSAFESWHCPAPWSLFDNDKPPVVCTQAVAPVVDNSLAVTPFVAAQVAGTPYWSRNYQGVFSAHLVAAPDGARHIVALVHGENKGEQAPYAGAGTGYFPNSLLDPISNPVGQPGGECYESHGCYFGTVGVAHVVYDASTSWGQQAFTDVGPILWPSAGYLDATGRKVSNGPRHPSSIVKDGRIYVFYQDHIYEGDQALLAQYDSTEGRQSGLKVARSTDVSRYGNHDWRAFYLGAFDQPTLPPGWQPETPGPYQAMGPLATPLFGASHQTERFSVARVNGTDFFLGAETQHDYTCGSPGWRLSLRASRDLVNWSERTTVYGCLPGASFQMHYALFLDEQGSSNVQVDGAGFYLLGSWPGGREHDEDPLMAMHLSLQIGPTP